VRINPVYVNPANSDYDLVDWDFAETSIRIMYMSVYIKYGLIGTWANGTKNYQYQLAVL
jgi:hypothetical protein